MRVLHVVNDAETGGAQTLIEGLCRAHRSHDIESHVVVLKGEGALSARLAEASASVIYARVSRRTSDLGRALRHVRAAIRTVDPHVIHSHLFHSDALALLARRSAAARVSTVHTSSFANHDPMRSRVLARLIGMASSQLDAVVACSSSAAELMSDLRYRASRQVTIPNGVSVAKQVRSGPPSPSFVTLARWHPVKDYRTLFEAFALVVRQFPGARLTVAGHGVERTNPDLMNMLRSLSLTGSVDLPGFVDNPRSMLPDYSALVISSKYGEALPMAGLEALSVGVPVISTSVGDCHRLTTDPAWLAKPGDASGLASKMIALAQLTQDQEFELRTRCLQLAQRDFSIDRCAQDYAEIYGAVIR